MPQAVNHGDMRLTPDGLLACRSCPAKWPMPARYMATPLRTTGESATDWPLCTEHMQHAMVAGWFPINEIESDSDGS